MLLNVHLGLVVKKSIYVINVDNHHCFCDVLRCLLSYGADINLRDQDGQSPLFVASFSGYYDIVILLTAYGALRNENVKAQCLKLFPYILELCQMLLSYNNLTYIDSMTFSNS